MEDWGLVWSPPFKAVLAVVVVGFVGVLAIL